MSKLIHNLNIKHIEWLYKILERTLKLFCKWGYHSIYGDECAYCEILNP